MTPRIVTFTSRCLNPLDPRPDDLCIEDIAHGLACCNRFAGQTREPLSVAQHSVYVSLLCGPEHALQGLLHDASESFLGDMTKWLKQSPTMKAFREAEDRVQAMIFERFGCATILAPEVDEADRLMVRYEAPRGFAQWPGFDHPDYDAPLTPAEVARIGPWAPWDWEDAENAFLARYTALGGAIAPPGGGKGVGGGHAAENRRRMGLSFEAK